MSFTGYSSTVRMSDLIPSGFKVVSSSLLEIVQLANGEIVLKRDDDDGEPLVSIRFSEESIAYIGESDIDIAKVMIQAGMQAAAHISESTGNGGDLDVVALDEGGEEKAASDTDVAKTTISFEELENDGDHILH